MPSAATLLGELTWDVEPNAAQHLGANVDENTGIPDLLAFLSRLSLVPAIVNTLLDELDAQPMERALIAYDVAARSLLGTNDAALLERIGCGCHPDHAASDNRVTAEIFEVA
jgi:hypothetical protein